MSAVVIGAMPADGRVYPHTALVLTWFNLKRDRDSPFMVCFLETPLLQRVPKRLPPGSRKIFLEIRRKQTALPRGELRPSELAMKEKEYFTI